MNTQKLATAALGILAVIFGAMYIAKPSAPTPQPLVAGSVTSPDLLADHFSVNGVTTFYGKKTLMATSTGPVCSIQSPLNGPSILTHATLFLATTTSSVSLYAIIATSTTPYSTTTVITERPIGVTGNNSQSLIATSSTLSWVDGLIGAGTYVNFSLQGSTTAVNTGNCQAAFRVLSTNN